MYLVVFAGSGGIGFVNECKCGNPVVWLLTWCFGGISTRLYDTVMMLRGSELADRSGDLPNFMAKGFL